MTRYSSTQLAEALGVESLDDLFDHDSRRARDPAATRAESLRRWLRECARSESCTVSEGAREALRVQEEDPPRYSTEDLAEALGCADVAELREMFAPREAD